MFDIEQVIVFIMDNCKIEIDKTNKMEQVLNNRYSLIPTTDDENRVNRECIAYARFTEFIGSMSLTVTDLLDSWINFRWDNKKCLELYGPPSKILAKPEAYDQLVPMFEKYMQTNREIIHMAVVFSNGERAILLCRTATDHKFIWLVCPKTLRLSADDQSHIFLQETGSEERVTQNYQQLEEKISRDEPLDEANKWNLRLYMAILGFDFITRKWIRPHAIGCDCHRDQYIRFI